MQQPKIDTDFDYDIAIVRSIFNADITNNLLQGALDYCAQHNSSKEKIAIFHVPGAFEIPFMVNQLIQTNKYAGILTLGAVIKGQSAHFEYISQSVFNALAHLNAHSPIPISLGIITTYDKQQALNRSMSENNKGAEAMSALHHLLISVTKL